MEKLILAGFKEFLKAGNRCFNLSFENSTHGSKRLEMLITEEVHLKDSF